MAVLIDGVEIVKPSTIEVTPFILQRAERAASGRLRVDIIAEKRALQLGWSLIKDADMKQILDLLSAGVFHQVAYPDPQNGESHTISAKVDGEIRLASWRTIGGVRYWRDVGISLIEE